MAGELFRDFTYNTFAGKIILSDNIQVFPTANRGQKVVVEDTSTVSIPINLESRLQTESNLTNIGDGQYKNYIKSWSYNEENPVLECFIDGYYFKITGINLSSISDIEPTYIYIKLKQKTLNSNDYTWILDSFKDSEDTLDANFNDYYYFTGLFFTTEPIGSLEKYCLKLTRKIDIESEETNNIEINYEAFLPSIKTGYGAYAIAEGYGTTASGESSHAEGYLTNATEFNAHAEGYGTEASGPAAHAEGTGTTASGGSSHAEGENTTASGDCSHAEGSGTQASGDYSHAEGGGTFALGDYSHAEGKWTFANYRSQHVFGESNIQDSLQDAVEGDRGNYVEIVGNGTDSTPSNARTLDWDGNEWTKGKTSASSFTIHEADATENNEENELVNFVYDTATQCLKIKVK